MAFNVKDFFDPGGFYHDSKKKEVNQEVMMPEWQQEAGKSLADFVQKYIKSYEPGADYSGLSSLSSATDPEKQGLGILSSYLSSANPESLNNASKVVNDTLSGGYDPYSSNYYSGMRRNLEKERGVALAGAKRNAAKYGYRTSSIENKRLGQVEENTYNRLSDIIAQVQENERGRQLNAVPFALQVAQAETNVPLQKVQASQQYGSLSRLLEGVNYQDFLRKQTEKSGAVNAAGSLYGTSVPYGVKNLEYTDPTTLSKMLGYAGSIVGLISSIKGDGKGGGSTLGNEYR